MPCRGYSWLPWKKPQGLHSNLVWSWYVLGLNSHTIGDGHQPTSRGCVTITHICAIYIYVHLSSFIYILYSPNHNVLKPSYTIGTLNYRHIRNISSRLFRVRHAAKYHPQIPSVGEWKSTGVRLNADEAARPGQPALNRVITLVYPPPSNSHKWRFIGIPYQKWDNPGGGCYWVGGSSKLIGVIPGYIYI